MNKAAFAPYKLSADSLEPLRDAVIVRDMSFDMRQTSAGIVLLNDNGTGLGIRPRWAQVYAVGPEQQDVRAGDWICVAHGRWTRGIEIDDNGTERTIRRVDPGDILLVSDEQPQDDTMSTAEHVESKHRFA
jgi:co-chaperonin GroES (HSP10)